MKSKTTALLGLVLLVVHLAACGGGGGGGDDGGGGGDFTLPAVISTTPAHNSIEVETNRAITTTFSEAIDSRHGQFQHLRGGFNVRDRRNGCRHLR